MVSRMIRNVRFRCLISDKFIYNLERGGVGEVFNEFKCGNTTLARLLEAGGYVELLNEGGLGGNEDAPFCARFVVIGVVGPEGGDHVCGKVRVGYRLCVGGGVGLRDNDEVVIL